MASTTRRTVWSGGVLAFGALLLSACAGEGGVPAAASPAAAAWLQSAEGTWTRDPATLARLQAQSEGTTGIVVSSAERTATVTSLARTGGNQAPIVARFEGMSGDEGRFRANVTWGGRFATYTYTCRVTDQRTMRCRMQIDTAGGWDVTFIRA